MQTSIAEKVEKMIGCNCKGALHPSCKTEWSPQNIDLPKEFLVTDFHSFQKCSLTGCHCGGNIHPPQKES